MTKPLPKLQPMTLPLAMTLSKPKPKPRPKTKSIPFTCILLHAPKKIKIFSIKYTHVN